MDWLTAVTFEALEQIVGQQLDQQIQTIGFEITCRNAIDGKPVLGFLNVIFHAAALIVESPQIDRFPFQISHHGFVLPVRIEYNAALALLEHLRLTDDRYTTRLVPGGRLVDQANTFDDPLFVDISRPVTTSPNFLGQPLGPFQLADIADVVLLPQAVKIFTAKAFVEPCVLHFVFVEQSKGLPQEVGRIGGRVRIARSKHGVQV